MKRKTAAEPRADTGVRPYVLEKFRRDALRHLADLPPADGERWILRHGLLSLAPRPELSDTLRQRLEAPLRRNLAANLLHIARFRQVVDALADLPVCPLKGIHLLATVYAGDPEHRVMSDLDLLVRPGDAPEATARLERAPHELTETTLSKALHETARARDLTSPDVHLDLHTRVTHAGGAWDDADPRPGEIHGRRVHLLDAETVLAHLTIHFVHHGPFLRLGWVEDLLRWTAEHRHIDGPRVEARARLLGGRRLLLAGVRLLRRGFGVELVPTLPSPSGPERLRLALHEGLVWRRLAADPWSAGARTSPLRRALSGVLLADRPCDAFAFLRSRLAERRHSTSARNSSS